MRRGKFNYDNPDDVGLSGGDPPSDLVCKPRHGRVAPCRIAFLLGIGPGISR
jgi:hypothetical protein